MGGFDSGLGTNNLSDYLLLDNFKLQDHIT